MGNRLQRILKHRWHDEADTRRAIPPATLERLAAQVADSERRHTGEIRIYVEAGLPMSYLWRGATARERAIAMFGKLGVWDTEENNGVLIYLLLADRAAEIVVDRGIHAKVEAAEWRHVCRRMEGAFAKGEFEDGVVSGIEEVSRVLARHFPPRPGDRNELPDKPAIL